MRKMLMLLLVLSGFVNAWDEDAIANRLDCTDPDKRLVFTIPVTRKCNKRTGKCKLETGKVTSHEWHVNMKTDRKKKKRNKR